MPRADQHYREAIEGKVTMIKRQKECGTQSERCFSLGREKTLAGLSEADGKGMVWQQPLGWQAVVGTLGKQHQTQPPLVTVTRPSDRISLSTKSWLVAFLSMITGDSSWGTVFLTVKGRTRMKLTNHFISVLCEFGPTDFIYTALLNLD